MIFRALQTNPNNSDFLFANSADVERLRITSTTADFSVTVDAPTFVGDLNGTINTATTGITQTAGNNSTKIATTAYADAAAAAVPIGNYLPLSAGSGFPLTGDLWLDDNSGASPSLYLQNGSNNYWRLINGSTGIFSLKEGTSDRITILPGGNVGIGTTNPTSKLVVGDLANTSGALNDIFVTGDKVNFDGYYARLIFGNSSQSGGSTASIRGERKTDNYGTELTFYTNTNGSSGSGTERMRIGDSGAIKFNNYNSTNNTGTPTYLLGTDASGNVVKTLSSSAPGSLWLASGNDIYNTNSANVGIGTTGPNYKLVVAQNNVTEPSGIDANTSILIKNNTWSGITMISTETTGGFITFGDDVAGFAGRIQYSHSNNNMVFETAAGEKMRIKSNGDVQAKRITSDTAGDVALSLQPLGSTKHYGWRIDSATGSLNLDRADTNDCLVTYDDSGNVGIGTTSPDSLLTVSGSSLQNSNNAGIGII